MTAAKYRRLSELVTRLMVKGAGALTMEEHQEYRKLAGRMERATILRKGGKP